MTRDLATTLAAGLLGGLLALGAPSIAGFSGYPALTVDTGDIVDLAVTGPKLASTLTFSDRAMALTLANTAGAGEDLTVQASTAAGGSGAASGSVIVHVEDGDGAGADGNIDLYPDGNASSVRIYSGAFAIFQAQNTGSITLGYGSDAFVARKFGVCSVDPPSIDAETCDQTVTCTATGTTTAYTVVFATLKTASSSLTISGAQVSGNDTITLSVCNVTTGAVDAGALNVAWEAIDPA